MEKLALFAPRFVSITYGAGGSAQERTQATVARIRRKIALNPAAHLTCIDASREEIDAGANRAITQFIFGADMLLRFRLPPDERRARTASGGMTG